MAKKMDLANEMQPWRFINDLRDRCMGLSRGTIVIDGYELDYIPARIFAEFYEGLTYQFISLETKNTKPNVDNDESTCNFPGVNQEQYKKFFPNDESPYPVILLNEGAYSLTEQFAHHIITPDDHMIYFPSMVLYIYCMSETQVVDFLSYHREKYHKDKLEDFWTQLQVYMDRYDGRLYLEKKLIIMYEWFEVLFKVEKASQLNIAARKKEKSLQNARSVKLKAISYYYLFKKAGYEYGDNSSKHGRKAPEGTIKKVSLTKFYYALEGLEMTNRNNHFRKMLDFQNLLTGDIQNDKNCNEATTLISDLEEIIKYFDILSTEKIIKWIEGDIELLREKIEEYKQRI